MAEIIEIHDPSQFQSKLDEVASQQEFVVCIFTGTTDPETGKNWCPDCERAKPNINEVLLKNTTGKVLMCIVKRAEWSGRSDHPYKQSQFLRVRGVPTVLLIADGQVLARAERDEDFDNQDLLLQIARHE